MGKVFRYPVEGFSVYFIGTSILLSNVTSAAFRASENSEFSWRAIQQSFQALDHRIAFRWGASRRMFRDLLANSGQVAPNFRGPDMSG